MIEKLNVFIQRAALAAFLLVVDATAFKQPAWFLNYTSICLIFGVVFIALALLPCGQQVLGERKKALPFKKYVGLLLVGQGALLILSLTVGLAFVSVGPKFTEGFIVIEQVQSLLKHQYLTRWGIFPWSLFGMWGLMIAYIAYTKKAYPLVGNIARLSFANIFELAIKNFSEYIIFIVSLLCFLLSLVAAILLLSYSVDILLGLHTHLFIHFTTLIILSLLPGIWLLLGKNPSFLNMTKNLNVTQWLYFLIGAMVCVLVFCAGLGEWCLAYFVRKAIALQSNCDQYFQHISTQTKIVSVFWGWFLLWVPLAGSFIAKVSAGRTMSEVVIGVLSVPIIFLILYMGLMSQFELSDVLYYFNYSYYAVYFKCITYVICSILTLFIIFSMIRGARNNLFFYAGFMPLPNPPKRSTIDLRWAPKLWGLQKLFNSFAIGVVFIILAHTLGGWFIMSCQLLALGILMMLILSVGSIGFVYHLFKETGLVNFYPQIK